MTLRTKTLKTSWVAMPFGSVRIELQNGRLIGTTLSASKSTGKPSSDNHFLPIVRALDAYITQGKPLEYTADFPRGTDFQRRVWQQLSRIPAGKTLTYSEVAERIGSGARAVANACRQNPLPLFVPCHRVVAANGLGGFMGKTNGAELNIKKWLLAHEAQHELT